MMNRRGFLKALGLTSAAALTARPGDALPAAPPAAVPTAPAVVGDLRPVVLGGTPDSDFGRMLAYQDAARFYERRVNGASATEVWPSGMPKVLPPMTQAIVMPGDAESLDALKDDVLNGIFLQRKDNA